MEPAHDGARNLSTARTMSKYPIDQDRSGEEEEGVSDVSRAAAAGQPARPIDDSSRPAPESHVDHCLQYHMPGLGRR